MNRLARPLFFLLFSFCIFHFAFDSVSARPTPGQPNNAQDISLVKRVIAARREYQRSLEQLHNYYESAGDPERRKWAEMELLNFHRIPQPAYLIDLDVAGPSMRCDQNVAAANELYRKAMTYKGKGFGGEYPTSNKCSDAAFQLGDIYENRKPAQYRRAATYYERCVQWNPSTAFDARMRAARLYERQLNDRTRAIELYKDVLAKETDERRRQDAQRRLSELGGT